MSDPYIIIVSSLGILWGIWVFWSGRRHAMRLRHIEQEAEMYRRHIERETEMYRQQAEHYRSGR